MCAQHRLKKSEFLEVRLPHPTKQAFMARCRLDGRSASEAVRGFIDGYLSAPSPPASPGRPARLLVAGAALLAFGLAAAPSFARTSVGGDFARLDLDHDGRVSMAEFDRAAAVQVALSPRPAGWLANVGLEPVRAQPALSGALRIQVTAAAFAVVDADRDGGISLAEYRRWRGA